MGTELVRIQNWESVLFDFVEANRYRPFEWGLHDCALFAANWVAVGTGYDPAKDFRGEYSSRGAAYKALKRVAGTTSLFDTWTSLTADPIPITKVGRGDIVGFDSNGLETLGVCVDGRAYGPGDNGLVRVERPEWVKGWRV